MRNVHSQPIFEVFSLHSILPVRLTVSERPATLVLVFPFDGFVEVMLPPRRGHLATSPLRILEDRSDLFGNTAQQVLLSVLQCLCCQSGRRCFCCGSLLTHGQSRSETACEACRKPHARNGRAASRASVARAACRPMANLYLI